MGTLHEPDEIKVVQGIDQVHVGQAGQLAHDHAAHLRIQVYWIDDLQVRAPSQFGQRRADVPETVAKALAPVARHQQQPAVRVEPVVAGLQLAGQRSAGG
ncbi:hypothetical protein D3C72_1667540 [compost metagenome]